MMERIRDLGFEAEVVESADSAATVSVERVSVVDLPDHVRAFFEEAERRGVPVLLDFTAPG